MPWNGAPGISIPQAGLAIGSSSFDFSLARQFELSDSIVWQRSRHRFRFGIDWEHHRGGNTVWMNQPATITLFSPDQVRAYNALPQTAPGFRIPLPSSFRTLDDILELPLQSLRSQSATPAFRRRTVAWFADGSRPASTSRTHGVCIKG